MKTTNHDSGRLISRAHEECDEPIRVSAKAFLAFQAHIQAELDALVAEYGNPRRILRRSQTLLRVRQVARNAVMNGSVLALRAFRRAVHANTQSEVALRYSTAGDLLEQLFHPGGLGILRHLRPKPQVAFALSRRVASPDHRLVIAAGNPAPER